METCWVRSCINHGKYNPNIDLYPLPANGDERILWAEAFGLTLSDLRDASVRVCGAHFRRKYFLNKSDANQNINGSAPLVMLNTSSASNPALNNFINSSVYPSFFALQSNQEPDSYRLHIPESNKAANVNNPSTSCNTSSPIIWSNAISSNSSQSVQVSTPANVQYQSSSYVTQSDVFQSSSVSSSSSQNVFRFPNKTVPFNNISSDSSDYKPKCSQSLSTVDSCELFCKEEKLTPEQEKFQQAEWLNYVKFTAKLHNFPYLSVVNGSEVGEKVSDSLSAQELPVLLYTNIPQPSQSAVVAPPSLAFMPPVSNSTFVSPASSAGLIPSLSGLPILVQSASSTSTNTSFLCQIPSSISKPFNAVDQVNATGPSVISTNPPVSQANTPSATIHHIASPSIPVKLNKINGQTAENSSNSQAIDEGIFPMVLRDTASENLLQTVNDVPLPLSPIVELNVSDEVVNVVSDEAVPSPAFSVNSGNERYMSPDPLTRVEVKMEDNESLPLMSENAPALLGSELECDNSNGPKVVDVISGDAGANEFFKGISQAEDISEQDTSQANVEAVPSENSMPKLVTQWSIFSMQKTIAVISSGTAEASVRNLLGLRIHIPPLNSERDIPTRLKNRLREENFLTLTPWWMAQKRYLPTNPPCPKCNGKAFRFSSCSEFLDNLCWTCIKCREINPVKRPKFFDRFPSFSLEELLLLTYHWACKSRLWVINYDVPVHIERIWEYFNALQDLCGESVSRSCFIGKTLKHTVTVEVSAVKLGRFFVLCAYDRRSKVSRLKALTTEEACGSLKHIHVLEEWLGNHCTLITWKKLSDEFLPKVVKMSADPSIGHVQSPGRHILNASKYLGKTMVQLFQNINHEQLTLETVQRILNEVQWRERHGRNEESAFWEILNDITRQNESYTYTEAQLGDITKDRFYYKADVPFRLRWGPYDTTNKASITMTSAPVKSNEAKQMTSGNSQVTKKTVNSTGLPCSSATNNALEIGNVKIKHPISVAAVIHSKDQPIIDSPMSAQDILSIKIIFTNDEKVLKDNVTEAYRLGINLRSAGYLQKPVRWMCKQKFIKDKSICYVCKGPAVLRDNPKFVDGVSLSCLIPSCKFENEFQRPSFFALGIPLKVILAIVYHWAVQSDYNTITQNISMNEFSIIGVYRRLQNLCAKSQPLFKIGGKKHLVEVAFVRFANCFILGAMERETKLSRFCTFSSETKLHIDLIRKTLISWLYENTTVVVNSNKYLGRYSMEEKIHLVFADQSVTDVNSTVYHTLTITNYLQGHIKTMFQSIKVQKISANFLQIYLDELMWRERFGRTPEDSFKNITKLIFSEDKNGPNAAIDDNTLLAHAALHYGFRLPLPNVRVCLEKLPEHVIHSYTSRVSSTEESITIVDDFEPIKEIKQEPDSDEEIEVVELVPNSESVSLSSSSSRTSVASSSTLACETNDVKNQIMTIELTNDEQISDQPIFTMKKSDSTLSLKNEAIKRYADKCYSHKKRSHDFKDGKNQCIECKNIVSEDHFVKQYSCGDCKPYVYSTHCQKAFARHRSYVLFGRKICDDTVYNRNIQLPQKWYCSCGYGSKEGNKLASHLIKCKKSTCYLKSDDSIVVL